MRRFSFISMAMLFIVGLWLLDSRDNALYAQRRMTPKATPTPTVTPISTTTSSTEITTTTRITTTTPTTTTERGETSDAAVGQPPAHTVRVDARGATMIQVRIDGEVVFNGFLPADTTRSWAGNAIELRVSNADDVDVTFDDGESQPVGTTNNIVTVRWPRDEEPVREATYYVVQPGDTLGNIALEFDVDANLIYQVNNLTDPDLLRMGTYLMIPGSDGSLPSTALLPPSTTGTAVLPPGDGGTAALPPVRGNILERMTRAAREAGPESPFYKTTWVTYYGRPGVPVMGILGEYDIDGLIPRLRRQAAAYDEANGDELGVTPAFHLVYGMATKGAGLDNSYLVFETDERVEEYIERAKEEDFAVILDIQIGALSPAEALSYGFRWLEHENVHLALDPEFAMVHDGQAWPGDPIGYVTAAQINAAQAAMDRYMRDNEIDSQRVLLAHQFLYDMIRDKDQLKWDYENIALTISADGWGGPWGKISKYNTFIDGENGYSAFKLFYRWDEPLMTEGETLGEDAYADVGYMEVTPNLIMYQ